MVVVDPASGHGASMRLEAASGFPVGDENHLTQLRQRTSFSESFYLNAPSSIATEDDDWNFTSPIYVESSSISNVPMYPKIRPTLWPRAYPDRTNL